MEIGTLPTLSKDSERLVEMHGEWLELRLTAAQSSREPWWVEATRDLALRIVEHRSMLFSLNAQIHAERDIISEADVRALDANQDAVKFCTVILGEMNAALGRTSLPP